MPFTPRITKRTDADSAAIKPRTERDNQSSLSEKDYNNLRIGATESLSSKFNLMGLTEAGDDKLTSTYTINMVLQSFC